TSISGDTGAKRTNRIIDRSDAWNVLHFLRDTARFPELTTHQQAADSIDEAISQADMRMRELFNSAQQGKVPSWARKEQHPIDRESRPIAAVPAPRGGESSDAAFRRLGQEVWDFARGKKLRWKRAGFTPEGRQCDVLTFSGSDEIVICPTGIELPTNRK